MSEVEFDRLLDAVRTAVSPAPHDDFSSFAPPFDQSPKAANDNQVVWGLVPFPDGWYASC
jgi:hypothetical protein